MKERDRVQLTRGSIVHHRRYGSCTVQDVLEWGVVIRPTTEAGKAQHAADSQSTVVDHLEDSLRRITLIQ